MAVKQPMINICQGVPNSPTSSPISHIPIEIGLISYEYQPKAILGQKDVNTCQVQAGMGPAARRQKSSSLIPLHYNRRLVHALLVHFILRYILHRHMPRRMFLDEVQAILFGCKDGKMQLGHEQ